MRKIITTLLTGLGLGVVVGILFAPQSGKRTRKDLQVGVANVQLELRRQLYAAEVALHDFQDIDWEELEEKAATEIRENLQKLNQQIETIKHKLGK
jgi:gas vesicle protein